MIRYITALVVILIGVSTPVSAQEEVSTSAQHDAADAQSLGVAGISFEPGDDEPRVLYIMPWQPPTMPRRSRTELNTESSTLMKPLNPMVLERHRQFKQTLNPNMGSDLSLH